MGVKILYTQGVSRGGWYPPMHYRGGIPQFRGGGNMVQGGGGIPRCRVGSTSRGGSPRREGSPNALHIVLHFSSFD